MSKINQVVNKFSVVMTVTFLSLTCTCFCSSLSAEQLNELSKERNVNTQQEELLSTTMLPILNGTLVPENLNQNSSNNISSQLNNHIDNISLDFLYNLRNNETIESNKNVLSSTQQTSTEASEDREYDDDLVAAFTEDASIGTNLTKDSLTTTVEPIRVAPSPQNDIDTSTTNTTTNKLKQAETTTVTTIVFDNETLQQNGDSMQIAESLWHSLSSANEEKNSSDSLKASLVNRQERADNNSSSEVMSKHIVNFASSTSVASNNQATNNNTDKLPSSTNITNNNDITQTNKSVIATQSVLDDEMQERSRLADLLNIMKQMQSSADSNQVDVIDSPASQVSSNQQDQQQKQMTKQVDGRSSSLEQLTQLKTKAALASSRWRARQPLDQLVVGVNPATQHSLRKGHWGSSGLSRFNSLITLPTTTDDEIESSASDTRKSINVPSITINGIHKPHLSDKQLVVASGEVDRGHRHHRSRGVASINQSSQLVSPYERQQQSSLNKLVTANQLVSRDEKKLAAEFLKRRRHQLIPITNNKSHDFGQQRNSFHIHKHRHNGANFSGRDAIVSNKINIGDTAISSGPFIPINRHHNIDSRPSPISSPHKQRHMHNYFFYKHNDETDNKLKIDSLQESQSALTKIEKHANLTTTTTTSTTTTSTTTTPKPRQSFSKPVNNKLKIRNPLIVPKLHGSVSSTPINVVASINNLSSQKIPTTTTSSHRNPLIDSSLMIPRLRFNNEKLDKLLFPDLLRAQLNLSRVNSSSLTSTLLNPFDTIGNHYLASTTGYAMNTDNDDDLNSYSVGSASDPLVSATDVPTPMSWHFGNMGNQRNTSLLSSSDIGGINNYQELGFSPLDNSLPTTSTDEDTDFGGAASPLVNRHNFKLPTRSPAQRNIDDSRLRYQLALNSLRGLASEPETFHNILAAAISSQRSKHHGHQATNPQESRGLSLASLPYLIDSGESGATNSLFADSLNPSSNIMKISPVEATHTEQLPSLATNRPAAPPVGLVVSESGTKWALSHVPNLEPIPLAATVPAYLLKLPNGQIVAAALTNAISIQGVQRNVITNNSSYREMISRKFKSLRKSGNKNSTAANSQAARQNQQFQDNQFASSSLNTQTTLPSTVSQANQMTSTTASSASFGVKEFLEKLGFGSSSASANVPHNTLSVASTPTIFGTVPNQQRNQTKAVLAQPLSLSELLAMSPSVNDVSNLAIENTELSSLPVLGPEEPDFSFADESQLIEQTKNDNLPSPAITLTSALQMQQYHHQQQLEDGFPTTSLGTLDSLNDASKLVPFDLKASDQNHHLAEIDLNNNDINNIKLEKLLALSALAGGDNWLASAQQPVGYDHQNLRSINSPQINPNQEESLNHHLASQITSHDANEFFGQANSEGNEALSDRILNASASMALPVTKDALKTIDLSNNRLNKGGKIQQVGIGSSKYVPNNNLLISATAAAKEPLLLKDLLKQNNQLNQQQKQQLLYLYKNTGQLLRQYNESMNDSQKLVPVPFSSQIEHKKSFQANHGSQVNGSQNEVTTLLQTGERLTAKLAEIVAKYAGQQRKLLASPNWYSNLASQLLVGSMIAPLIGNISGLSSIRRSSSPRANFKLCNNQASPLSTNCLNYGNNNINDTSKTRDAMKNKRKLLTNFLRLTNK